MSQFTDRYYFDYKVSLRPNDWLRSWFRFSPLNLELVPYFFGSDISVKLHIKPTKTAIPSILNYEWRLYKKNSIEPENIGKGVADMVNNSDYKTTLLLKHFSYTDEYRVDVDIMVNGNTKSQTMGDLEITSRANALLSGWWVVIGGVVGYLIGSFV